MVKERSCDDAEGFSRDATRQTREHEITDK